MENKNTEINELLLRLKQESLQDYKIVDFWEADITAIGIQVGTALIYISTFNYDKTNKYNIIIEKYDTGEIIEKERESIYNELVEIIQKIQE
ncbi:hypothetical protein [uncultured Chryseobacterium sp.]|uniref:hypothetical protein n=1 Tax=uncultured Chryseobacterium sp. TaxID=259322 RepID=UPI0025F5C788|nr:hypothetical protein [uncultured Chryseobacterium sp.]